MHNSLKHEAVLSLENTFFGIIIPFYIHKFSDEVHLTLMTLIIEIVGSHANISFAHITLYNRFYMTEIQQSKAILLAKVFFLKISLVINEVNLTYSL